ncbi:hypothetical protein LSH36_673g00000 [Paralvinella palmiformis]|uniref:Uncharacterized protein n=1 Tax=Paralvinella palmiformis TaxID=53620 RepID=A0AAD9J2W3_9ANNE|nr:hypothetical protein LSH36_673g00000 [Paralvinella palmiformis]
MCWPRDETLRKRWVVLIRNDNLPVTLNGTAVCELRVRGGRRTYDEKTPTILSWTPEWTGLITEYNKMMVTDDCSPFTNDHQYNFPLTPKKLCYSEENDLIGWGLI